MSENNWWLHKQLTALGANVAAAQKPLVRLSHNNKLYLIYTPNSDEYIITVDIVDEVKRMGGTTISYPTSWCKASREAVQYGRTVGVEILPHGALFAMVKK